MIQSYFHIPVGYLKNADCEEDMSPYGTIIRLFTNKRLLISKYIKIILKILKVLKVLKF